MTSFHQSNTNNNLGEPGTSDPNSLYGEKTSVLKHPKTAAERMKEYRLRKKMKTAKPVLIKCRKTAAEYQKAYRLRKKLKKEKQALKNHRATAEYQEEDSLQKEIKGEADEGTLNFVEVKLQERNDNPAELECQQRSIKKSLGYVHNPCHRLWCEHDFKQTQESNINLLNLSLMRMWLLTNTSLYHTGHR